MQLQGKYFRFKDQGPRGRGRLKAETPNPVTQNVDS